MSKLYVIATPIGHLEDISFRALRILKEADLILCEDTRVTRKLLNHYQISKPTISYHQHSRLTKLKYISGQLEQDKKLALVSDAGTPLISDPGAKLISYLIERLSNLKIIPVPGPSALATILSIAGFPVDRFTFLGFPPNKKKRKKFFQGVINSKYPVIFYESPHRIIKSLEELDELRATKYELRIVVGRELTKKFETIYRGNVKQVIEQIKKDKIKGEFVVVVK
ncbi:MAG: 16S rRNA (cytidine(1402)-2'-O)-methyltransferase [Parcubacteria group bacterium]|jgi:16S rRNA (cytidine1402-2'-O)-methyltransferase|nr:16S rRNA (cytidine(1402)-2'-O)-methyltransferase [Parcubacteria group bacterium]|tara:strand:+ start:745 stop:1419 length:675 start_codon:yes stop_codon:yes gene_type:complete